MPTLRELEIKFAKKQSQQINYLTEETPILAMLDWQKATHQLSNVFERVKSITEGSFVDLDAPLSIVGAATELDSTKLLKMGGRLVCGFDKGLAFGSATAYFESKIPLVLSATGMAVETQLLYDNFRAVALDNDRVVNIAAPGTTSNDRYSILAVRFKTGENNGLYPGEGFPSGYILKPSVLNGGNQHNIGPSNYPGSEYMDGTMGYAMDLSSYFGWQIANVRTVAVIPNIKEGKLPTSKQLDELLRMVRASNNTFLFMHPAVNDMLVDAYRDDIIPITVTSGNVPRTVNAWNGIPFVTSYNFLPGTEALV
jgi:hypothetical protein